MRSKILFSLSLSLLAVTALSQQPQVGDCNALNQLILPGTQVLLAEQIPAGTGTDLPPQASASTLPDMCRVMVQMTPTPDSDIRMELWLPQQWNGSFRGQGNAGFAGAVDYRSLAGAVSQGYATAATDAGHAAGSQDATWAVGHPEKMVDFGYRAIHLMTTTSQALIRGFYGIPPLHSFFSSCSDGGREALMEAQRYPRDYDGIVAGDAAYNWTGFLTKAMADAQTLESTSASYIAVAKLPLIHDAVLAACGVGGGTLDDPRTCSFDPSTIVCSGGDVPQNTADNSCLTPSEAASLKQLYTSRSTAGGELISPGLLPGGELGTNGWSAWLTGTAPGTSGLAVYAKDYFADMVYGDPQWTYGSVSVDTAYADANATTAAALNATETNLTPFFRAGGKLIMYHGWNDPAVPPQSSIDYFNAVSAATGRQARIGMRLYMVPGMQHCAGGPGATFFGQIGWFAGEGTDDAQHDVNLAIEDWVRQGIAPQAMIASQLDVAPPAGQSVMTHPLCPYPQEAVYDGSGNPNDAGSYACRVKP